MIVIQRKLKVRIGSPQTGVRTQKRVEREKNDSNDILVFRSRTRHRDQLSIYQFPFSSFFERKLVKLRACQCRKATHDS